MNRHPTLSELEALVRSALGTAEQEVLMDHLTACDDCFAAYDELWAEVSRELPALSGVVLDSVVAERVEGRLFRFIHVSSLATAGTWFVTDGFLRAALGVLLPIVDVERSPALRKRGERP